LRLLLTTLGTTGDVLPFVPLAERLVARGHAVTVAASAKDAGRFAATGAAFVPVAPRLDEAHLQAVFARAAHAGVASELGHILEGVFLADAETRFASLGALAAGHDGVVAHSLDFVAQRAALAAGRPAASVVFCPAVLPGTRRAPGGAFSLGRLGNRLAWRAADRVLAWRARPLAARLDRLSGLQAPLTPLGARSPLLTLVAASPQLALAGEGELPGVVVTGPWAAGGEPGALGEDVQRFAAGGPVDAVVTFSSMSGWDGEETGRLVATALRRAGMRALVQAGAGGLSAQGDGAVRFIGAAPHARLFPLASLVVHHGGAGTTHAALLAGRPSVVVPHVQEQAVFAATLHALGVAPRPLPRRRLTVEALASRLVALRADARAAGRARALAEQLRGERGVERAVEALEGAFGAPSHRAS
jgi:UDP:flavonoid glycosyltransferase YjiC (YdhE family)